MTIKNRFKIDTGNKIVHENFNKSKDAIRGKVALINIKTNIKINVFNNNQNTCSK